MQNRLLSPNTVAAYARDLSLFFRFLNHGGLGYDAIGPATVVGFLDFLTHLPVRRPGKRQTLAALHRKCYQAVEAIFGDLGVG